MGIPFSLPISSPYNGEFPLIQSVQLRKVMLALKKCEEDAQAMKKRYTENLKHKDAFVICHNMPKKYIVQIRNNLTAPYLWITHEVFFENTIMLRYKYAEREDPEGLCNKYGQPYYRISHQDL